MNGTYAITRCWAPDGVSFSSAGDMFVADTLNNRVARCRWPAARSGGSACRQRPVHGGRVGRPGSPARRDGGAAVSAELYQPERSCWTTASSCTSPTRKQQDPRSRPHLAQRVERDDDRERIYTIAGTGTRGSRATTGRRCRPELNDPGGFALNGTASLYISDSGNGRIRVVSGSTFAISAFAGDGASILSVGDNGPALGSAYQGPSAVITDAAGNIYIADQGNNRVQEIAASDHTQFTIAMTAGDVYTIAGHANGAAGDSGDGGAWRPRRRLNAPTGLALG